MKRALVFIVLCILNAAEVQADYQSGDYQDGDRACQWGNYSYSSQESSHYYSFTQCHDVALDCYSGQSYSSGYWRNGEQFDYSHYSSRWEYCSNGFYSSCWSYSGSRGGESFFQPEECQSSGEKPKATRSRSGK